MKENLPIKLADGHIVEWRGSGHNLEVNLMDWQENPMSIRFNEVVAVLALSPEGVELSHLERSNEDPLLRALP